MILDLRIWYDTHMREYALLGLETPKWVRHCDLYICHYDFYDPGDPYMD